jgi:hypothetical protein
VPSSVFEVLTLTPSSASRADAVNSLCVSVDNVSSKSLLLPYPLTALTWVSCGAELLSTDIPLMFGRYCSQALSKSSA